MKSTLYDWRKQNVAHMKRTHERMCVERDGLNGQIEEIVLVIAALEAVKLKRPPKAAPVGPVKPKRKLSEAHKRALANGRKKWMKKNGNGKTKTKKKVTNVKA